MSDGTYGHGVGGEDGGRRTQLGAFGEDRESQNGACENCVVILRGGIQVAEVLLDRSARQAS